MYEKYAHLHLLRKEVMYKTTTQHYTSWISSNYATLDETIQCILPTIDTLTVMIKTYSRRQ